MNPITMILILGLLVAIWWLLRKRREESPETSSHQLRPKTSNTLFHAVSIDYEGRACDAAKKMSGRRFLATAAPKLPLPECDILECSCRFTHHEDRRTRKDRRSPFGPGGSGGSTGSFSAEQRAGSDRRHGKD
jgi:hypothetical protein